MKTLSKRYSFSLKIGHILMQISANWGGDLYKDGTVHLPHTFYGPTERHLSMALKCISPKKMPSPFVIKFYVDSSSNNKRWLLTGEEAALCLGAWPELVLLLNYYSQSVLCFPAVTRSGRRSKKSLWLSGFDTGTVQNYCFRHHSLATSLFCRCPGWSGTFVHVHGRHILGRFSSHYF